ncbi:MAG: transketolase [Bacilli bacterium]|nr:transketolase [Bacilli bacterium]
MEIERNINENKIIDNIRCLSIDMIKNAGSGHPGIALGAAPIIYTLYAHHLNIDSNNPDYFNRDRFVMSAGHGSTLLYATLYFAGYDLTLDDLKEFRQINSKTPGHPEYMKTPGVDMTTGPLGQGFATAVGMAIAERYLNAKTNDIKKDIINHYTYVLCGDGDLMEGVSYEASALAGHLKLNKLIVLYDSNNISLDGETNKCSSEDITMRFMANNWNVITVENGESIEEINKAIEEAKLMTDKPTIIQIKTTIGKYSNLEGSCEVHGSSLTEEDISNIKAKLDIRDIPFTISQNAIDDFRYLINSRCKDLGGKFDNEIDNLNDSFLNYLIRDNKSLDFAGIEYNLPESGKEATRKTSGKVLESIVKKYPMILGGAADVFKPTKTYINDVGDFTSSNYSGQNIWYGVREHAMACISNGLALCGLRPYAATFLAFSDYMKPAIRMSSMMNLPVTYIFTHDSISVGEDGPTHEPVEQLLALRSMPNLDVFRPADVNEVLGSYKTILEKKLGPSALILARNDVPILDCTNASEVEKGGYIVKDFITNKNGILISSGEELHLALKVAEVLQTKGIDIRVVSVPNLTRFMNQDSDYIDNILPVEVKKVVIEASSSYSWNRIVYNPKYLITLDTFGKSGKKEDVYKEFGFDIDSLSKKVEELFK